MGYASEVKLCLKSGKTWACEAGHQIKGLAVKFNLRDIHCRTRKLTPVSCLVTLFCAVRRLIYNVISGMPLLCSQVKFLVEGVPSRAKHPLGQYFQVKEQITIHTYNIIGSAPHRIQQKLGGIGHKAGVPKLHFLSMDELLVVELLTHLFLLQVFLYHGLNTSYLCWELFIF